jgi:hypothetical protein
MQPSVFISSEAYKRYGPFPGVGGIVMEYGLWLKLGKIQMPKILPLYLSSFRLTAGNLSSVQTEKILAADHKLAASYTNNSIVLWLHRLHNWARIFIFGSK